MSGEQFEEIINGIINRLHNTLIIKGREYSRGGDRLHNFNIGATITNQTRERVLDGFFLKHYISYRDILDDIDRGELPSIEYVEEKLGDMMVYLMLLEASIKSKIVNSNGEERARDIESSGVTNIQKGLFKG